MSRNGSGVYSRVSPPGSGGYVSGDIIDPSIVNNEIDDIGDEITNSIDKGGRTTPTANLPMGGFKHTGVGNGAARTDYVAVNQIQDNTLCRATATGTTNAWTLTIAPALTSYVSGSVLTVAFPANNTAASTVNVNGLGAKSIKKFWNNTAVDLNANDILASSWAKLIYNTTFNCFILENPCTDTKSSKSGNGYTYLPSGVILQWGNGTADVNPSSTTVTFPIAFPTDCLSVVVTQTRDTSNGCIVQVGSNPTATTFTVETFIARVTSSFTVAPAAAASFFWQAVGY